MVEQFRQAGADGGLSGGGVGMGQGHLLHRAVPIPRPIADGGDEGIVGDGDAVGGQQVAGRGADDPCVHRRYTQPQIQKGGGLDRKSVV